METLLDDVCDYLHNYFRIPGEIYVREWTVQDGGIECDFLQENQYFRVKGSVFNDGVWQYPASGMTGETFVGEVWAMAVPPAVIALLSEIAEWQEKYGGASSPNMSPYQSESFNNYSYSKASGGQGGQPASPASWQDVFYGRLVRWKKL